MNNIFEALRESHDKQKHLLNLLANTTGDSDTRRDFYHQLKVELSQHAIAEERYFYTPLINADMTIEHARHGIAEHHKIDKLIEQLDNRDFSSPTWLSDLKKLQHLVEHHLEEEEKTFFQLAGKIMTNKQKTVLAQKYQKEMAV